MLSTLQAKVGDRMLLCDGVTLPDCTGARARPGCWLYELCTTRDDVSLMICLLRVSLV